MDTKSTLENVVHFFENISNYYGCKTEITSGIYSKAEVFDADFTTWNLSEFILICSAYRKTGDRFMFEGSTMYFEISASYLIDFKQPGRHKYEFIEQYSEDVFRITKIKFYSKY